MGRPRKSVDVQDVKAMLRMADREWANNGLIPSVGQTNTAEMSYMAMRFLDAYRGDYPSAFPSAVASVDEFVGNLFFSIINTVVAQTSAQDPEPIIRPLGGTAASDDAWRRAWLNQKIVTALIREKKFRREVDRAFLSSLILPFGMVRHGFTPEVEYEADGKTFARFKNQTPDLPWIQFVRPWQTRMDPLVTTFDMDAEVGWIAFQNLYRSRSEIDNNEGLIHTADWKPSFHYDLRPYHERRKPAPEHSSVISSGKKKDDSISMWEEWVIYDASKRTYFGVSHGSEKLTREEKEWPLEWGQLPASIITLNEQLDSPFGVPFPKMIWNEMIVYNKIWTILKALVNRARRLIFVSSQSFATKESQLENLLNPDSLMEFIECDGNPNEIIKEVSVGMIDGQLVGLLYQLKEQIWEVLGVSNFDRGQRANVQTAAEATQIGAGSAMTKSRIQARFEAFWVDTLRAAHRALLNTEDSRPFVIPLIGEDNYLFLSQNELQQGFVKATLKDIQGEFDYGVKLNSTTPIDPGAELAKFSGVYTAMGGPKNPLVNHVYANKRAFTLAGEDADKLVIQQQVAEQMGQGMAGQDQGNTPQPMSPADAPQLQDVTSGAGGQ